MLGDYDCYRGNNGGDDDNDDDHGWVLARETKS